MRFARPTIDRDPGMHGYKAALLGAAGVAVAGVWYLGRDARAVDDVRFQTEAASIGRIESIVNTVGTIVPVVSVEVGSELSGLVSELHADFNSEVERGQVIARIDDRTIRARLKQTEADLASARANVTERQANVTRARADLELARNEVARQRELSGRQLSSQSDRDRAEADLKVAEAQVEVAEAQLLSSRAAVLQREAQLEQAELDLERTYIRSPVDGIVIDRQVDVGQTVAANLSTPVLYVIAQDLTKMQIEADVDEADIGQVHEGMPARFSADAYPGRTFAGSVSQVRKAATLTSNVVTYKVIVTADNPAELLLPGMTADVDIVLGAKDGVLRVSNSALRFNPPGIEPGSALGGFGGGGLVERAAELADELGLDAAKRAAVEAAAREMQSALEALRNEAGPGGPGGPIVIGGPGGGGFPGGPGQAIGRARQRFTNSLSGVLSAEELAQFERLLPGPGGGPVLIGPGGGAGDSRPVTGNPDRGAPDAAGSPGSTGGDARSAGAGAGSPQIVRRGLVWVLEGGRPRPVPVQIGLSDSQYTEVRSDALEPGHPVIVRVAR
jgi:HlyD family secretion protein